MQVLCREERTSLHIYAKCYSKLRALNPNEWLESVWFTSFLKVNRKDTLSKCRLYKFYGHRFAYAKGGRMGRETSVHDPFLCCPVRIADDVNAIIS